jgi:glycosyltransferase involved in cell wall biosynthesis
VTRRILHCHSTFSLGGKEARAVRLMNAFGDAAEHTILSAMPDQMGARDAIDPAIAVHFPTDAPSLQGKPGPGRYRALADYMRGFDLVLSYNWGSMDVVGARRMFPAGCPPLIHHEDGFNADEADRLNWKRNLYRRMMLPAAEALVVPSERLEGIARTVWNQPQDRLHRIPNGIDTSRYAVPPEAGAIPGLMRQEGDIIIGTLAGLRAVKNLPRLVRAVAALPAHVKLVIVGEGPERAPISAEAAALGMTDRLLMPGFLAEPHRYVGHFDVFALSSDSEQFPISLVEAMAAGLPAVATDVGDVKAMVAFENRDLIVPATDEPSFAAALDLLAWDAAMRRHLGSANAEKARADFDEMAMISRYATLYGLPDPATGVAA